MRKRSFIDQEIKLKSLLLIDSINGYAIGNIKSDDEILSKKGFANGKAIALKYTEEKWTNTEVGEGEALELIRVENVLFLLKRIKYENPYTNVSVILSSVDNGNNWQELTSLPFLIKSLHSINPREIYTLCRAEDDTFTWTVRKYDILNKTWSVILSEKSGTVFPFFYKGSFALLSYSNSILNLKIIGANKLDEKTIELNNPKRFFVTTTAFTDTVVYIAGHQDVACSPIFIYKYNIQTQELYKYAEIDFKCYSPISISVSEGVVSLVVSKISGIDTKKTIIYTMNNGTSWGETKINNSFIFTPFFFLENVYYGYDGFGSISRYKLLP